MCSHSCCLRGSAVTQLQGRVVSKHLPGGSVNSITTICSYRMLNRCLLKLANRTVNKKNESTHTFKTNRPQTA